jgi:hypothetical protein
VRFFEAALVGKVAKDALQASAVGIFQSEGTGDLAGADVAGMGIDEGENVFLCRGLWGFYDSIQELESSNMAPRRTH